jgi:hypothetical protein
MNRASKIITQNRSKQGQFDAESVGLRQCSNHFFEIKNQSKIRTFITHYL